MTSVVQVMMQKSDFIAYTMQHQHSLMAALIDYIDAARDFPCVMLELNGRRLYMRTDDVAYFERLYQTLNNHDTICTFWSYLMGLSLWGRVRTRLRIRAIVLYWLGLTEKLMEESGVAYERDMAEAKSLGCVGD